MEDKKRQVLENALIGIEKAKKYFHYDIALPIDDETEFERRALYAAGNIIDAVMGVRIWDRVITPVTNIVFKRITKKHAHAPQHVYNIEHPSEQDWFEFPYQGEIITVVFGYIQAPDWEMEGNYILTNCEFRLKNCNVRGVSIKHPNDQYDYYYGKKCALRDALSKDYIGAVYSGYKGPRLHFQIILNAINDRSFRQMVWKEFFKAHGRNERGEVL